MRIMKVALVSDCPVREIGGVESYCFHLIKEIKSRDDSIEFCPINISNIKYRFIKKLNLYIYSKKELTDKIRECDLVHINGLASYPSMQAIDIARKLHKPIICTSHFHPSYALSRPFWGDMFYRLIVARRLKHIDYLVAINKEEYDLLSGSVKKCSLIPHWINTEDFEKQEINPRRENSVLFVGKVFKKHKRADFMNYVPETTMCWYVSSAKMAEEKQNFIQYKDLSNEDLAALYSNAKCLIVPSKYEAFSFVALEALLKGTPVLLSDRVRIADFLEGNRLMSIFEYDNVEDFKCKLAAILDSNITLEEREAAVESVRNTFNPDKIIGTYLELYHSYVGI